MDFTTIVFANALVPAIFSIAYAGAFQAMKGQVYWRSWTVANVMFAATYFYQLAVPPGSDLWWLTPIFMFAVAGVWMCFRGARQFNGVTVKDRWLLLPFTALAVGAFIYLMTGKGAYYRIAFDITIGVTSLVAAREYALKRRDHFAPRLGLACSFVLLTATMFLLMTGHILLEVFSIDWTKHVLPYNDLIALQLVFLLGNGSFCLALAFERKLAEQRETAIRDPLTGAFNRRELMDRMDQVLEPNAPPFAFLLVDLDHFKSINDQYGHDCGDEALKFCVKTIHEHLRPRDCLARVGGEEFAILMPDTGEDDARHLAERIRKTLGASAFGLCGQPIHVTLSAGLLAKVRKGMNSKAILGACDKALYKAKSAGRNRVEEAIIA